MRGLIWLVSIAACTVGSTRVHLVVHGDPAWNVDQYQVAVGDRMKMTNAYPDLELVLPDDMAGHEHAIDIAGFATGAQVAFGTVSVTPRLHAEVFAEVTLAMTACPQSCDVGETVCAGAGTTTCIRLDNGCPAAGEIMPCPASAPFCMAGACVASCDMATCTTPPPPTCASAHVRRTYRASGTCGATGCEYAYDDVKCPDGCLAGTCVSVSSDGEHACALEPNGSVVCWGNSANSQNAPPSGTFAQVAAGHAFGCALRSDGTIACWGSNLDGKTNPPAGTFVAVAAGGDFACAIRTSGTLACWGDNADNQATPPAGTYTQVACAYGNACALASNGTLRCWGRNLDGQSTPPSGTYIAVSAGDVTSVALDGQGHAVTWGSSDCFSTDPCVPQPNVAFATISSGSSHKCGITTAGTLACWGDNPHGEASPPSGTFAAVSAGEGFTCGIQAGGSIRCWGYDSFGNTIPP